MFSYIFVVPSFNEVLLNPPSPSPPQNLPLKFRFNHYSISPRQVDSRDYVFPRATPSQSSERADGRPEELMDKEVRAVFLCLFTYLLGDYQNYITVIRFKPPSFYFNNVSGVCVWKIVIILCLTSSSSLALSLSLSLSLSFQQSAFLTAKPGGDDQESLFYKVSF